MIPKTTSWKVAEMLEGMIVTVSHLQLDHLTGTEFANYLCSRQNPQQCGVMDQFEAWVKADNWQKAKAAWDKDCGLAPATTLACGCVHHGILAGCPVHSQQASNGAPMTAQEHNAFPEGRWAK